MATECKMSIKVVIFFVFAVNVLFAQKKKAFIENVTDFYSKTDTLPFFIYYKGDLDTLIALNKTMRSDAEIYGVKCEERIVFSVDRNNKINNIRHEYTNIIIPQTIQMKDYSNYDTLKLYFQKESERVVRLTEGLWFSDSLRAKKEIRLKIYYKSSAFDALNNDGSYTHSDKKTNLGALNTLFAKKVLYNFGVKNFQAKKIPLAKVYFEEAIKFFPKDIDAHYNLATCYYKLKNVDKACEHWRKCVELGDNTVEEQIIKYCK
jgi:tetratricopeptide (TPR) repeat protein